MLKRYFQSPSKLTKFTAIAVSLLLVAGVAYGGYLIYGHYNNSELTTKDGGKIKLEPATEEEKKQAEDQKSDIVKEEAARTNTSAAQKTPSNVIIVNASSTGVRAYVTGVFEEGGTCTATATSGGQTVNKSSSGFQNVSYSQCAPINWDAPLGPGTWKIMVAYTSVASESSSSTTIEVK